VPNFVSVAASIAELAHGEKSRSILTHPAYLMHRKPKRTARLELQVKRNYTVNQKTHQNVFDISLQNLTDFDKIWYWYMLS